MRKISTAASAAVILSATSAALACQDHAFTWEPQPASKSSSEYAGVSALLTASEATVTDPAILAWKQNLTGAKGTSPNTTINNIVSQIPADVQTVYYNTSNVYVNV